MIIDPVTGKIVLTIGYQKTDKQRYGLAVDNSATGDRVHTARLSGLLDNENVITTFSEYVSTVTPATPVVDRVRLFSKNTGLDSKLFVLDNSGVVKELATNTNLSLDGAYNNGSSIDVDTTDVTWKLTGARSFSVTNAGGGIVRFAVSNTQTDIQTLRINSAYVMPTADGGTGDIITTDGAGVLSFTSVSALADGSYLRLDGTNSPITGNVRVNAKLSFNKTAAAVLDVLDTAQTGTVDPTAVIADAAHTALTASTERTSVRINVGVTQQFATGALALQRAVRVDAPTYGFVAASTLTDAMTVWISGAPVKGTNATLTNTHALYIGAGAVSTAGTSYGLTVNAQTGATDNYAAQFLGGLVALGKGYSMTKTTATIATGAITYGSGFMEIDTEASGATDDLDTITAGIAKDGTVVVLKSTNNGRVPTVKHGTGNIRLNGGSDRALDNTRDRLTLQYDLTATEWVELSFSSNA